MSMTFPTTDGGLYQRPLVATDLSTDAAWAARMVPRVCAPGVRGTALMVLGDPDLPRRIPDELREEILEAIERRGRDAEAEIERWARELGLDGWTTSAPVGRVASTIVKEAHALRADIILMGSRGHGRVERGLLGSVSRAVLHRAGADVLVARPRAETGPLGRILVATDLHPPSVAAAARAMPIVKANGTTSLCAVHVLDRGEWLGALAAPEGNDVDSLRKHLEDELGAFVRAHLGGQAVEVVASGRAARTIVAKAEAFNADLVVLGTHGGGPLSRAMIGSVADAVAERASCSVLVVRPSADPAGGSR